MISLLCWMWLTYLIMHITVPTCLIIYHVNKLQSSLLTSDHILESINYQQYQSIYFNSLHCILYWILWDKSLSFNGIWREVSMKSSREVILSFVFICLYARVACGVLQCYLFSLSPAIVPIGYTGQNVSIIVECDINDLSTVSSSFLSNGYAVVCIHIFIRILTLSYRFPQLYYFISRIIYFPYLI